MSVTVSFTGDTNADLAAQAAAFFGTVAADTAPAADKPARGSKASKAEDKKPAEDEPTGPTIEEIRELAGSIEKEDDQDKAFKLLEDAGAESISDLAKKSAKVRQTVFDGIKEIVDAAAKAAKRKLG